MFTGVTIVSHHNCVLLRLQYPLWLQGVLCNLHRVLKKERLKVKEKMDHVSGGPVLIVPYAKQNRVGSGNTIRQSEFQQSHQTDWKQILVNSFRSRFANSRESSFNPHDTPTLLPFKSDVWQTAFPTRKSCDSTAQGSIVKRGTTRGVSRLLA